MYPSRLPLRENLTSAHEQSWQKIAQPGDFLTAAQRVDVVRCARESLDCHLCDERKASLSPAATTDSAGTPMQHHCTSELLSPTVVDFVHRLRTDPGRITQSVAKAVMDEIGQPQYVELVAVLNSSVIIDTLHNALGLGVPTLESPQPGKPKGQQNPNTVDEGAWLPILAVDGKDPIDTGLPQVPNIARSLGLVPSALDLFFSTFRPHYALKDISLSISQAEAEFVASRVSAINECFY